MNLRFKAWSIDSWMTLPDELAPFFVWLMINHESKRAESIMVLIAEHDRETDLVERENIRRTITELLYDQPK